jgi:hypothetical protein
MEKEPRTRGSAKRFKFLFDPACDLVEIANGHSCDDSASTPRQTAALPFAGRSRMTRVLVRSFGVSLDSFATTRLGTGQGGVNVARLENASAVFKACGAASASAHLRRATRPVTDARHRQSDEAMKRNLRDSRITSAFSFPVRAVSL